MTKSEAIKSAVYRVGGPTKAAILTKVSTPTIHYWIKQGRIRDFEKARLLASASGVLLNELWGAVNQQNDNKNV